MSSFLPEGFDQKKEDQFLTPPASEAGNLSPEERELWKRLTGTPADISPEFKKWLEQYILVNIAPQIPAAQLQGFSRSSASCRLRRTSNQGDWVGGVRGNVVWTEAEWDPSSMWDGSTKVIPPFPGKYLVITSIEFSAQNGQLEVWKNDSTREAITPTEAHPTVMTVLDMNKGDFIQVKVVPDGSSTIVNYEANHTPYVAVVRLTT